MKNTAEVLVWWRLTVGRKASPCKLWRNQRKVGPPHSGLWLSATVGGEGAFKREGELLRVRQPMGKGRTAGDSPTRPPSIIQEKACLSRSSAKVFHQQLNHIQRTLGGGGRGGVMVLTIKCTTHYIYGRICTMTTLGKVGNPTFIVI